MENTTKTLKDKEQDEKMKEMEALHKSTFTVLDSINQTLKKQKWLFWTLAVLLALYLLPFLLEHGAKTVTATRKLFASFGEDLPKKS